jgi:predicted PurR-regulated permease PerM
MFVFFYFLRDGEDWIKTLKKAIPIARRHKEEIFSHTNGTLYALLYGQIITSLIQGFLGGLGFFIFGVDHPIFWGMIMAFVAIFPVLGAWLVWAPAATFLFLEATLTSDAGILARAIGLAIYSLLFVSLSDNFLRPYIVAGKANIHPLIVILGVFGGIAFFGLSGFVLGPLLLALFVVFLQIYMRDL